MTLLVPDFIVEVLSGDTATLVSAKTDSIVEVVQGAVTAQFTVKDKEIIEVYLSQGPQGIPGTPGPDTSAAIVQAMSTHVQAINPHPTYDDTPDLTLLFQNGII